MMKALDLFCGAGGATRGLQRAGFHVTGVDIRPQPRYCGDAFVQADAAVIPLRGMHNESDFDFVWASPPCQRWTAPVQQRGIQDRHPDLITPMRRRLREWATYAGGLYCIENVPRTPLRTTLVLTGCMFGASTYRKRKFETNFVVLAPLPGAPFGPKSRKDAVTVAGSSGGKGGKAAWQSAMGIDWMTNAEMAQAVPPAYAEFIGRAATHWLTHARSSEAAA